MKLTSEHLLTELGSLVAITFAIAVGLSFWAGFALGLLLGGFW